MLATEISQLGCLYCIMDGLQVSSWLGSPTIQLVSNSTIINILEHV